MTFRYLAIAVGASLSALGSFAQAGGLGIGTQSGSGTGNAFAGGAASAEDASTVWYNPAGMTQLPGRSNAAIVLHAIRPSFKFRDSGSTLPPGSGDGGDGGSWEFVPQAFFTTSLTDRLHVGVAFNVPFGLATEYDSGWRGEPLGRDSKLTTYNLNVALAYKLNDFLSLGGGFDYQRGDLKFNSVPAAPLGLAEVKLDDNAPGLNAGIMITPTKTTRVGLHYRSSIKYDLRGTISASPLLGGNSGASGRARTPDSASLSFFTQLTPQWELMADVTWTAWSKLKHLRVDRNDGPFTGTEFTTLTFNWDDTWRYALGANYKLNPAIKLRFGVAFDETPTNNTDRTPRVPDQDRTWVAVGGQFRISKAGVLDLGYAHEFIRDAKVDQPGPLGGRLTGKFKNKADILSVQYSHSF